MSAAALNAFCSNLFFVSPAADGPPTPRFFNTSVCIGCAQEACAAVSRTSAAPILARHPLLMGLPADPIELMGSFRKHCPLPYVVLLLTTEINAETAPGHLHA